LFIYSRPPPLKYQKHPIYHQKPKSLKPRICKCSLLNPKIRTELQIKIKTHMIVKPIHSSLYAQNLISTSQFKSCCKYHVPKRHDKTTCVCFYYYYCYLLLLYELPTQYFRIFYGFVVFYWLYPTA